MTNGLVYSLVYLAADDGGKNFGKKDAAKEAAFQKSLSFVNMFAILKTLENLVDADAEAKEIAQQEKNMSISFNVKDGPKATLHFSDGRIWMEEALNGKIKLAFSSPEHFNAMIDGKKNPGIRGGLIHLGFLTKKFTRLTDILTRYLRATESDLQDKAFFEKSTTLMLHLISNALSALGNYDKIGNISAQKIPDGSLSLEIKDGPSAEIVFKNHRMTTYHRRAEHARSFMIFENFEVARGLFDGTLDSYSAIARGLVQMKGFIPMIDNINRLLSRVAYFLA